MRTPDLRETFHHFQTFLWLRWRIRVNQLSHSSAIGKALAAVLLVAVVMSSMFFFIASYTVGAIVPQYVPQGSYFLFWDGFILVFGFVWLMHVITDLQRSDAVTFDRILQLPVSFWQAFAVNYLSSLISLPFLCIASIGIGFSLGSCISIGPRALLLLIPFFATIAAATALTYQLQGWLAAIMANPRRRQMVIILLPLIIIVISQIPAIFATRFAHRMESTRKRAPAAGQMAKELRPLDAPVVVPSETTVGVENSTSESTEQRATNDNKAVSNSESRPEMDEAARHANDSESRAREYDKFIQVMTQLNFWLPPLWMAGSAQSIVAGSGHYLWQSALLAIVAYLSLRRNYRQTLRYYRGEGDTTGSNRIELAKESSTQAIPSRESKTKMIEWQIPWVDETTSAMITMTWQSMKRAPEVKMYFLLPFIFPVVMLGVLPSIRLPGIEHVKACFLIAASGFALLISSGIMGNQFGYDRAGFRAFVLSPMPRDRILFGRNLAMFPILVVQLLVLTIGMGLLSGLAFDKLIACLILSLSMIPLFVLLFNVMSMLAPFPIAAGSIQPKHFDLTPVLLSMLLTSITPLIAFLAMIPIGVDWAIGFWMSKASAIPMAMLISFLWFLGSLFLYRWILPLQGILLAKREKEILRIVTSRIE
ncbi:MAG: hypothetical protein ABL921_16915 [Pirellula sp.]